MAIFWVFVDQRGSWSNLDVAGELTRLWRIAVPIAKRTCSNFADFEKKVEIFPSAGGVLYSPQDVIWPIWLVLGTWLAHMASRG